MSDPHSELSDNEVVRLLTDGGTPAERNLAARRLQQIVLDASKLTRSYGPWISRWVKEDALGLVHDHLHKYRDQGRGLLAWTKSILRNQCKDLLKRQSERDRDHRFDVSQSPAREITATKSDGGRLLTELNDALLHFMCEPQSGELDYAAVFAFRYVLKIGNTIAHKCVELGERPSAEVIHLLPLNEQAWQRTFRANWPSLRTLWDRLASILDGGGQVSGKAVCRTLSECFGAQPPVNPAQWNKWVERSKIRARECLAKTQWCELIDRSLTAAGDSR